MKRAIIRLFSDDGTAARAAIRIAVVLVSAVTAEPLTIAAVQTAVEALFQMGRVAVGAPPPPPT